MTAPTVTEIPYAPARISDPENFAGERAIFIASLPVFRTQANALKTYLNALPIQDLTNDWGRLSEPSDPSAQITLLPTQPTGGDTPIERAVKSDAGVKATRNLSAVADTASAYMDFFSSGSFVVDGTRPVLSDLTQPPLAGDAEATFESRAIAFFAAVKDFASKLKSLGTYFFNRIYPGPDEDYGSITDPVTATADYGAVP